MINKRANDKLLFVTMTPLGFHVRVTHNYWKFITVEVFIEWAKSEKLSFWVEG